MRLQKYMAEAGIASRRKCKEMIIAGRATINGNIASIGENVAEGDVVAVDDVIIGKHADNKLIYIMLNKPAGVISSAKDQFGRPSVVDLVKGINERLYPVGRLDFHSTGLILLTNDGALAQRLTHPSYNIPKTYIARVAKPIKSEDIESFEKGIIIDGYKTMPVALEVLDKDNNLARVTLKEGRNRQIRKMFGATGNNVVSLKRISMGFLELGDLTSGHWRHLTGEEVKKLKVDE